MIQPITKLVQITPPTADALRSFNLTDKSGMFALRDQLESDIDEWCRKAFDDGPRSHLGASLIGADCDRHIWYSWRWFKHKIFPGRMQRLFQDGHWYEDRIIEMLRGIGCTYTQVTEDGQQQTISAVDGHFGGSTDGLMLLPERYGMGAIPFLGEFKTANDKSFSKFHDVEFSKPQHWAQTSVYGFKNGLRYGFYFVVNKNDADMKIELLQLDWALAERLINKADWIIHSLVPPPKISANPSYFACKFCDHHKVCQLGEAPDVNCRTCKHSEPIADKQWRCNRWNIAIPNKKAMLAGCTGHELIVT